LQNYVNQRHTDGPRSRLVRGSTRGALVWRRACFHAQVRIGGVCVPRGGFWRDKGGVIHVVTVAFFVFFGAPPTRCGPPVIHPGGEQ
jgi:hypothetical protein|tara:strand:- start:213 stop:473 length:261 start_codon:yes stop_codon:yes gene_type:complete